MHNRTQLGTMSSMNLKTYLRTLSAEDRLSFAARCGASLTHLKFVAYGAKNLSCELAINIERESAGAVRVEELRPDADWHVIRGTKAA